MKTSNRFPCLLAQQGRAGSLNGMRVGGRSVSQPEGWLSGTVSRAHAQYPAFAPGSSRGGSWVLAFLYLVHNLPQLHMHAVIFNPL